MLGADGQIQVKPQFLGKTIVLRGTLRNRNGDTLNVEDGSFVVPVVASGANPDIEPGSVVEATGVCVLDVENWRPNAAFPQIRGFFVVCGAKDGNKAVALAKQLAPDVVIMDIVMPRKDGVEATVEIRAAVPSAKIVVLTSFGTSDMISRARAHSAPA